MGIVRVSGRGQFGYHGSVVMAGWRCPEGDASSRWLIVIRTDLFLPTPTMIAVQMCMCAARAILRTAPSAAGDYLVQVSSQKNEADVQASYRALQNNFPAALGSRPPVIKRADLGDKGVYYRTMVGPFGSTEEAAQLCGNLKSAGGQCVVQKN